MEIMELITIKKMYDWKSWYVKILNFAHKIKYF